MLKEIDCPVEDRVLPIIAIGTESVLPSRESIEKMTNGNPQINRVPIEDFYKWTKSDNEIIAYCGYGYCDTSIPKSFNCLFNTDNPNQPLETKAEVKFSIWNGVLPIDTIDHGHKTICIISFENEVPEMLKTMPNWKGLESGNYNYNQFGLCDRNDFEQIINKLKNSD